MRLKAPPLWWERATRVPFRRPFSAHHVTSLRSLPIKNFGKSTWVARICRPQSGSKHLAEREGIKSTRANNNFRFLSSVCDAFQSEVASNRFRIQRFYSKSSPFPMECLWRFPFLNRDVVYTVLALGLFLDSSVSCRSAFFAFLSRQKWYFSVQRVVRNSFFSLRHHNN